MIEIQKTKILNKIEISRQRQKNLIGKIEIIKNIDQNNKIFKKKLKKIHSLVNSKIRKKETKSNFIVYEKNKKNKSKKKLKKNKKKLFFKIKDSLFIKNPNLIKTKGVLNNNKNSFSFKFYLKNKQKENENNINSYISKQFKALSPKKIKEVKNNMISKINKNILKEIEIKDDKFNNSIKFDKNNNMIKKFVNLKSSKKNFKIKNENNLFEEKKLNMNFTDEFNIKYLEENNF